MQVGGIIHRRLPRKQSILSLGSHSSLLNSSVSLLYKRRVYISTPIYLRTTTALQHMTLKQPLNSTLAPSLDLLLIARFPYPPHEGCQHINFFAAPRGRSLRI